MGKLQRISQSLFNKSALAAFCVTALVAGVIVRKRNNARQIELEALMHAQAKAQALAETDKLKTALLQMVSHDFRSPLASIKASVGSLLDDEGEPMDAETQLGLLVAIDQETDRLNRMVGNILDLSKLEAEAWRPRREDVSLSEMVGSTMDSFNKQQNDRIEIYIDSRLGDVWVDSVQFVQVLRNLLENALKYSTDDKVVELRATPIGSALQIEVLDRGPGLPVGEESDIFEPFYRARAHKESSLPGVGMGLAICRGLVEAHGGRLTAYNREGGGAAFRVFLPESIGSRIQKQ